MSHQLWMTLIKHKITPNQIYFLDCCRERIQPSSDLINQNVEKNICELKGLINDKGVLTYKALNILQEFETYLVKTKKIVTTAVLGDQSEEMIEKYKEYFPKKLATGPGRQSNRELKQKFVWFFKNHPEYTWDDVLEAANYYRYECAQRNNEFMANSSNFIKKDTMSKESVSKLADYCQLVIDMIEDEKKKENDSN